MVTCSPPSKYFKDLVNVKQYAVGQMDVNNYYTGFVFTKSLWNRQEDNL